MKKNLFLLVGLLISTLVQAQLRQPPTLTYRQGNANRLDVVVSSAGIILMPGSSLSITAEIRTVENGRVLISMPFLSADTTHGTIKGTLPKLEPATYFIGLLLHYTNGTPDFRAGIAKLEIIPAGALRSTTDVLGLTIQMGETKQVLDIKLDAASAFYAQQIQADVTLINTVRRHIDSTAIVALAAATWDTTHFVPKRTGYGLTQNNYPTADKNKLATIATGATSVTNNSQLTNGAGYQIASDVQTFGDNRYRKQSVGLDYGTDITTGKPIIPTSVSTIGGVLATDYNNNKTTTDAAIAATNTNLSNATTTQSTRDANQDTSINGKLPTSYSVTQASADATQNTNIASNVTATNAINTTLNSVTETQAAVDANQNAAIAGKLPASFSTTQASIDAAQVTSITNAQSTANQALTTANSAALTTSDNTTQIAATNIALSSFTNTQVGVDAGQNTAIAGKQASLGFTSGIATAGQVLTYNGTNWSPAAPTGGGASTSTANTWTDLQTFSAGTVTTNTSSLTTGTATVASISPTINQSGSAGYTGLDVNTTETSIGTGTKYLMSLRVNGGNRFVVSNSGALATQNAATFGGSIRTTTDFAAQQGIVPSTNLLGIMFKAYNQSAEWGRFAPTTGNFLLGTTTDATSRIFNVVSTAKFSSPFPKMTTTQRDALTGMSDGDFIYNLTTHHLTYYNSTAWVEL